MQYDSFNIKRNNKICGQVSFASLIFLFLILASCKKFIEVEPPVNSTNAAIVYDDAQRAAAVLTGIYTNMSRSTFSGGGVISLSLFLGLSADELTLFDLSNISMLNYYRNQLSNLNPSSLDFWPTIYSVIYITNDAIDGLSSSNKIRDEVKRQLLGEAKFIRAFCYFYLVNLYGDVPIALTTDYKVNSLLSRSPKEHVCQQVISDLKDAQLLLNDKYVKADALTAYSVGSEERVRPSKWAASALLARTYLFTGDWAAAEAEASAVINNKNLFGLEALNSAFKKNNKEAIWQLQPVGLGANSNTPEARLFVLPSTGPAFNYPVCLSKEDLVNAFEIDDQRAVPGNWIDTVIYKISNANNDTAFFAYKYKIGATNTATQEYSMILRLAEQFLIRAEARVQLGKLDDAKSDLNEIRKRAGLKPSLASEKESILAAIIKERKVELFTEWGHRWFDLKRSNTIDAVMGPVCIRKGSVWSSQWALFPIILTELEKNPNLVQNLGY